MKSQNGVTLTSLVVYIIAMVVVIGTIATITNYFYGNTSRLNSGTSASKEFTSFNSYFVSQINNHENRVINVSNDSANSSEIIFSSGNQFKFIKENGSNKGAIYYNKILICRDVSACQFTYTEETKNVNVTMTIAGKSYNNNYKLQN